jgi:polyferredoxin
LTKKKVKSKRYKMGLVWLRRLTQFFSLAFFLFLIGRNNYPLDFPLAPELYSRLSPLSAIAASIAARTLLTLFWPSLFVLASALLLGRAFCGWVCPLGTTIDLTDKLFPRRREKPGTKPPAAFKVKYLLLLGGLAGSVLGVQFLGYLDPLSLAPRSYIIGILAPLEMLSRWLLNLAKGAKWLLPVIKPVSAFAGKHIFSFIAPIFPHWYIFAIIILGITLLALWRRRGFCRMLCPLGAFLGACSRLTPFSRSVEIEDCKNCGLCPGDCKMGAIAEDGVGTFGGECILCLNCRSVCKSGAVKFRFTNPIRRRQTAQELTGSGPSRRAFIASVGTGLVLAAPRAFGVDIFLPKSAKPGPIRPPGALPEKQFLGACIRCGQCMRVCITEGLQPTLLEAGAAGMFSPQLVPRIGYCEYNCNLCGKVCPSGAIQQLALPDKQRFVIGLAEIDRTRCLPWAENKECLVCEEVCPLPQKAIMLLQRGEANRQGGSKGQNQQGGKGKGGFGKGGKHKPELNQQGNNQPARPVVIPELCIGCGNCENRCPLEGKAAITVSTRPLDLKQLPD